MKLVRVGEVLSLQRRRIVPDPAAEYHEIGVRSFGRGIFHKPPIKGSELGNKRVFGIEPGDLVLSNVFAWEGAIAVASEDEGGMIGSHRFMTFTPSDENTIDTSWAAWFFTSDPGLTLIRKASPGSAGRNRTLGIERFASLEIPLPPVRDQEQTAARLNTVNQMVARLKQGQTEAACIQDALAESAISGIFRRGIETGWSMVPLGTVADVNPAKVRISADAPVGWAPMAALDEKSGTITAEERKAGEVSSGYKQFQRGDVLFARITPSMQNGKCAIYTGLPDYGYGSTEFHVIRPRSSVLARWIHRYLRTKAIRTRATKHFTGTAGQQRVPAAFLREVLIPIPPESDQLEALGRIDRIVGTSARLRECRTKSADLGRAIEHAVPNQVFSSIK